MDDRQQIIVNEAPSFWNVIGDIVTDLLTQCVPGSVVILIVGVCMVPYIARFIMHWRKPK